MGRFLLLFFGVTFLFGVGRPVAFSTSMVYAAELPVATPESRGWNAAKLKEWDASVFAPDLLTDSALLIHGGNIIYERYARGYTPQMRHLGWSIAKSVMATVFAVAEAGGKISRNDAVTACLPEKKGSVWEGVNLRQLLTMSTGVRAREGYAKSPFNSDIVAALYRNPNLGAKAAYRLEATRREAPPDDLFVYSSGETNVLSACLKNRLGAAYAEFPQTGLFSAIGATSFIFERDEAGVFVGSSYVYATPRDFARIGLLYLQEGVWEGKRVLPAEWVKFVQTPAPPFRTLGLGHRPMEGYGAGFWLNQPIPTAQFGKRIAAAPADLYWAEGHEGQLIYIIPSLDLVVLRFGVDRDDHRFDREKFFRLLLAAAPRGAKK